MSNIIESILLIALAIVAILFLFLFITQLMTQITNGFGGIFTGLIELVVTKILI